LKISGLLLIIFIAIAVVGGGVSLMGYNDSLRVTTLTSTYTSVAISTGVVTLTSAETSVVTASSIVAIAHTSDVVAPCYLDVKTLHLPLAGRLHISYNVTGGVADFWLMDKRTWNDWQSTGNCGSLRSIPGIVHNFGSSGYDVNVELPSSGTYEVVFNAVQSSVMVAVNIDFIFPPSVVTLTTVRTGYSTKTSTVTTEMTTPVSQPAGLGMPFFSGIALVTVAVIAIAVAMKRKGRTAPSPTTPTSARPSPPQGPQGEFCMNCGAPLPSYAPYCSECGSKQ
jgi:hypothetical protein